MTWLNNEILEGEFVRLEPMALAHTADLQQAVADGESWKLWYAESVRRTAINTEAKLLLLRNLFEKHQAIAVEFRTHFFNHTSRKAIERLGAKMDGILRQHMILKDGSVRDTVVYSIIACEWPTVRRHLLSKLGRY